MQEAIEFMQGMKGQYSSYFMYPEGHERFIPGCVLWDLDRDLRDFWRGGNDRRLQILRRWQGSMIIVKKARIRDVDPDTHDLGAYPRSFVEDLVRDERFQQIFENDAVLIFRADLTEHESVPPEVEE